MGAFPHLSALVNHIRYRSGVCIANVLIRGPCLSVEQADFFDSLEHGAHIEMSKKVQPSHFASVPAVQLHGPLQLLLVLLGTESDHHPLGQGHKLW
jgi:hypothetical protein